MSLTTHHATEAPTTDLDAILTAEAALYELGYRDGHAAGLLESDRRVSDSVRRVMATIREGGLL